MVQSMFQSDPSVINENDAEGNTPLTLACHTGNLPILTFILQQPGVDVDETDAHGNTPLCIASMYGREPVVNLLLTSGANINKANANKDTPILIARKHGHMNIVKILDQRMQVMTAVTVTNEALNGNNPFCHDTSLIKDMNEYMGGKQNKKSRKNRKTKKSKKSFRKRR